MSDKKNNKKGRKLSPEARRRRNAARAKVASVFGVLAVCIIAGVVLKTSSSAETPLTIDDTSYNCLEPEKIILPDDEDGEAIAANADASDDEDVSDTPDSDEDKIKQLDFDFSGEYPIDMIISSGYSVVYDATADKLLYAKDPEEKCYPASTTKIMSSIVTVKNAEDDTVFTAGDELQLVNEGSSLAMLSKGNELDLSMIVDGMMLPSGNDAAYCAAANIGRILGGDEGLSAENAVQNFVDEMNLTAQSIGCKNTHFANPDGFHDDDHYTTVADMLRIALYAETFDLIKESAAKPTRYAAFLSGEEVTWENSNKLIQENSDIYYMYATGMKTGMTDEAGYCVVATAERFEHQLICIVFDAESSDLRWNDAIALLDAAFVQVRNEVNS